MEPLKTVVASKKRKRINAAQSMKRQLRFLKNRTDERKHRSKMTTKFESTNTFLRSITEDQLNETLSNLKSLFCQGCQEIVDEYKKFVLQPTDFKTRENLWLIKQVFWSLVDPEFGGLTDKQQLDTITQIFLRSGKNIEENFSLYNQICEQIVKGGTSSLLTFCDDILRQGNVSFKLKKSFRKAEIEFIKEMSIQKFRKRMLIEDQKEEMEKIFYRNEVEQMLEIDSEEEELPGGFSFLDNENYEEEEMVAEDRDDFVLNREDTLFDNLEYWE